MAREPSICAPMVAGVPRTIEYAVLVLSRALNQAVRWGYIPRNIAMGVEVPEVPPRAIRALDEQQARKLLEVLNGHRLEALYRTELSLGLRRGEVLALWHEDIDFVKAMITIRGNLQRVNGRLERSRPKTRKGERTLPLPPMLAQCLRDHLARQNEERQERGWPESPYVFLSERGTPIEPRNLIRQFKTLLAKAGINQETWFHDLRHSCATLLIAQGVHPRTIMEILGHSDIRLTMNIYGHVLPSVSRDAVAQLDVLLGRATGGPAGAQSVADGPSTAAEEAADGDG